LQGSENGRVVTIGKHSRLNRQIWYRHPNSEAGNDEIQNVNMDFYFVGIEELKLSSTVVFCTSSNNKTLNARLLARVIYNGMPLHVMEQPPRFFALAYRASDGDFPV
jgi:hypothetical protein